jgi:hypothetical protein
VIEAEIPVFEQHPQIAVIAREWQSADGWRFEAAAQPLSYKRNPFLGN